MVKLPPSELHFDLCPLVVWEEAAALRSQSPFPGGMDEAVSFEHYLQMEVSYRLSGCLTPGNLS